MIMSSKTLLKILLSLSICSPIITLDSVMIGPHIERGNKIFNKVLPKHHKLKVLLSLSIKGSLIPLDSVMIGSHIERDNKIFNKVLLKHHKF